MGCPHLAQLVRVAHGKSLHLSSRACQGLSMGRLDLNELRLVSLALPQRLFIRLT